MRLYWVEIEGVGEVRLTGSHDEWRWLSMNQLDSVDWLASDIEALPLICENASSPSD